MDDSGVPMSLPDSPAHSGFALHWDHPRIRVVGSFEELVSTQFADGVNALCWRRELAGDFAEVVRLLNCGDGITPQR